MNTSHGSRSVLLASLAFLVSAVMFGSPTVCPPDLTTDGIAVSQSCPGLGADVFAVPGTVWELTWNDNVGVTGNDWDYNDLDASIVVAANGESATVTWLGGLSFDDNELFDGSKLLFSNDSHPTSMTIVTSPGVEIPFELVSPGSGTWLTGAGSLNTDGQIHDWAVEENDTVKAQVAEPGYMALIGAGLLAVYIRKRRCVV